MKTLLILITTYLLACGSLSADKINAASAASIVEALHKQQQVNPPVFPLEAFNGGTQSLEDGLRLNYFGYGERRYTHRFDFHPAMDVAHFPTEIGDITDETGESWQVRAPRTYLKKVYAIQEGEFVLIRNQASGYKVILKHTLETPYYDNDGQPYHHYYTVYRHLDSRSLAYLDGLAIKHTGDSRATHKDLFGKYVFAAGEQIALVGFPPDEKAVEIPRAHLDFSLNLFADPNKGPNIRNYALNPLLLFPPFEYANPRTYTGKLPAYQFVVDPSGIILPSKDSENGGFMLSIHARGQSADGQPFATRYFVLNSLEFVLRNGDRQLDVFRIDRHRKLGYDTTSYQLMDNPNRSLPHMITPVGEQGDVYKTGVFLPRAWFEKNQYDWSKDGSVSVRISSIWADYLDGHSHSLTIRLPADD